MDKAEVYYYKERGNDIIWRKGKEKSGRLNTWRKERGEHNDNRRVKAQSIFVGNRS